MTCRPVVLSALVPLSCAALALPATAATGPPPSTARTGLRALHATTSPVLRLGSRGPAVVRLQQRLTALRYADVGPVDGVFGTRTLHGVVAFQKTQGIARDGVVGPVTWSRLADPYRPRPRYPVAVRSLEIDLTHQVVYVVRDGAVRRIADASTGSGALYYSGGAWHRAITPTGRFHVERRIDGWRHSPLGWMWRPNYFYGGYAVHGSTSVPSYPASHGCVRITIPTMNALWSRLSVGMPVAVYRG
jgi:hypothetical protein